MVLLTFRSQRILSLRSTVERGVAFMPFGTLVSEMCTCLSRWSITFSAKVRIVKAIVFPVVMYGCERWTIKKAEFQRIDAFKLWCWRRLLRVPWTARRPNKSILKEISTEYSLEGLMLKLKLQYFGYLMRRANSLRRVFSSLVKILMLGKIESRKTGDSRE